jgi:hypothetical protein
LLDQGTLGATLTADTLHIGQQELDVLGYTVRPGTWSHSRTNSRRFAFSRRRKPRPTLGVFQWFSNTVAGLGNSPQIRALLAWHRAPRWRQLNDEHRAHFEAAKQMVLTCGTALVRYNPRKVQCVRRATSASPDSPSTSATVAATSSLVALIAHARWRPSATTRCRTRSSPASASAEAISGAA